MSVIDMKFIHIVPISATLTIVHPFSSQQGASVRRKVIESSYNIIVASRTIFAKFVLFKANKILRPVGGVLRR